MFQHVDSIGMAEQRFAREILKRIVGVHSLCRFSVSARGVQVLCPYIMQQSAFKVSLDF